MQSLASIRLSAVALSLLPLLAMSPSAAQSLAGVTLQPIAQGNRVAAQPSLAPQMQMTGHLPAWVRASNQVISRTVDLSAPLHVTVLLRRDPAVQAAFEQVLAAQQDRSSPLYHQWLTPEQIGEFYGPTAADVAAVSHWLAGQGLRVDSIAPSRMMLEVSGSTAVVAATFHTSFAYYSLAGTPRLSASSEPSIPAVLGPVIDSIHGLTEIPLQPQSHVDVRPVPQSNTGNPAPQVNSSSGAHFLSPGDFDIIYDLNPVYNTNTGATIGSVAQHVAIIGRSRVAAADISNFETKTGLPSVTPNVVIPTTGTDPGTTNNGNQDEATLDVDRVIGTAYGAIPDLVISASNSSYDGIYIAASYEVNTLKDPIMTISFGACEANAGASGVSLWNTLFSTAAGEGISVFVSSGDSGAAQCDTSFTTAPASQVASINYICASSYATCVGGTEFNDTANPSTYWSSTNSSNLVSVLQYIPEGAWNEPTTTNSSGATVYQVAGTGGGASQYITKPTWQTGTGVPTDGHRDVPDVSLSASGHDGYYACLAYAGADCTSHFVAFSGTSASAPGMAGIAALLNTRLGAAQGNLNPLLYQIAASYPSAFHDTTITTSGVSGCTAATPSMCNNSTPGPSGLSGGLAGYTLTTGYDLATGLGSVDVANLVAAAVAVNGASFTLTPALTSLTLPAGATTGNTDTITVAATSGFSGTVNLTCSVTAVSGNANGTCSLSPNSVALSSGTASTTSSLKILTNAATSGTITVTVTGTSGGLVVTSQAIQVTVTGPYFTAIATPSPLTVATSSTTPANNTTTLQFTSYNGFSGTINLACNISSTSLSGGTASCSPLSTSVNLSSGGTASVPFAVSDAIGGSGTTTLQLTGGGVPSGGSSVYPANVSVPVTFVAPSFTLSPGSQSLSITSGATTGNTNVITLASVNGFSGTVTATCMVSTGTAFYQPTCSTGTGSTALTPAANGNVTVTINSTTAVTAAHSGTAQAGLGAPGNWRLGLASALMLLLVLLPLRRRVRWLPLAMLLLAAGLLPLSGCGKGGTTAPAPVTHSSAGTYVVTVTGTGMTAGSSTPVSSTATFGVVIQ